MACAPEGAVVLQAVGSPVDGTAQPAEAGAGEAPLLELGSAQSMRLSESRAESPCAGAQVTFTMTVRDEG